MIRADAESFLMQMADLVMGANTILLDSIVILNGYIAVLKSIHNLRQLRDDNNSC